MSYNLNFETSNFVAGNQFISRTWQIKINIFQFAKIEVLSSQGLTNQCPTSSPSQRDPRFRTEGALPQLPCRAGLIFIQSYWGRRQGLRVRIWHICWKKSGIHSPVDMVVYPAIYEVLHIPSGCQRDIWTIRRMWNTNKPGYAKSITTSHLLGY